MCLGIPGKFIENADPATMMARVDVCGLLCPVGEQLPPVCW